MIKKKKLLENRYSIGDSARDRVEFTKSTAWRLANRSDVILFALSRA